MNQSENVCDYLTLSFSIGELFDVLILIISLSSSKHAVGVTTCLNKNQITLSD